MFLMSWDDLPHEASERVKGLKELFLKTDPAMCHARAILVTQAYQENEADPIILKRSKALAKVLEELPIFIDEGELIVGHVASERRGAEVFPERHMDWVHHAERFETRDHNRLRVSRETKQALKGIFPFWKNRSVRHRMRAVRPDSVQRALDAGFITNPHEWNGLGHIAPDFERVLSGGLKSIEKDIKKRLKQLQLGDPHYDSKRCFLQGLLILIKATVTLAHRYGQLVKEMAGRATGKRAEELRTISDICFRVPYEPARSFHEALQSCWFIQLIPQLETNGFSITLGRFDQFMYPYLARDLEKEVLTVSDAQELLDLFWLRTCEVLRVDDESFAWINAGYSAGQNLTVGGIGPDGKDKTNLLSYMCLASNKHIHLQQPNFSVRLHKHTPDDFLSAVVNVISKGNGMPQVLNDEVIVPGLLAKGIPLTLAREYIPVGCDEITVKGHWGRCNGGYLNFAKAVELALNKGKCPLSGLQAGLPQTAPGEFKTFEQFKEAFYKQFDYGVALLVNESNRTEWVHAELEPVPYVSMLVPGCIESARDVSLGGAHINSSGPVGIASATAGDSLMAIKKAVYEERIFTMDELREMLLKNFERHELQRQFLVNKMPKFGNDSEEVDDLVVEITNRFFDQLEKYTNFNGGKMWAALYSVTAQVGSGNKTGATPDGRKSSLPLSDGLSPMYGCDRNGPTAALKSISRVDLMRAPNGVIVNQRISPQVFKTSSGFEKMKQLLRSFVDLGGFHWQFNSVSGDTLRDAQIHPDEHRGLVVRVAGYSAFFIDLSQKAQDAIIERTEATF